MKNLILLVLLTVSTSIYAQVKDKKSLIEEMNNFYNRGKVEKLDALSSEILSGKYGDMDDELKFYALMYSTNVYTRDEYAKKNPQIGYDKAVELINFTKITAYQVPNKDAYIKSYNTFLTDYLKKYPDVKTVSVQNTFSSNSENKPSASDNKTVSLTVSGTGKTLEEAKLNALRSAIEQAFGAFVSSKTEILNDKLVKDEIVSVTNGNIQKYDVISQVEIPNNGYAVTLNTIISINKLTAFIESKGGVAEFNGSLLSYNLKLKDIAKTSELVALNNLIPTFQQYLNNCIDYNVSIISENPKMSENDVILRLKLESKFNLNIEKFVQFFTKTLRSLSLDLSNVYEYDKLNIPLYSIYISPLYSIEINNKGKEKKKRNEGLFVFRNENTQKRIVELLNFYYIASNFEIDNGINITNGISLFNYIKSQYEIKSSEDPYRPFYFHDGIILNTRVLTPEGSYPKSKERPYFEFEDKLYLLKERNYRDKGNKIIKLWGILQDYSYFRPIPNLYDEVNRIHTNVGKDWAISIGSNTYSKYYIFDDNKSITPILIDFENLKNNNKVFTLIIDDYFPRDKLDFIKDYKINKINN